MKRWLPGGTRAPLSRDKQDTLLLIASTLLVLAPHAAHLPLWVSVLCGATLAWRGALTLSGRRMPRNWLLAPVAAGGMAGVYASYHTLLGRDAGVAMLVLLVAFKMLEMHARRDLFVVVFLCFFLALTNFFYSQGIGTALLMLVSVAALLTTQLTFQLTGAVPALRMRLLLGVKMLALALPLAAGLFMVFPRIQGPLWGSSEDVHQGGRGLSDTMAPGQVADLALSADVAFRVRFDGPVPPQPQLYWRGPVLTRYDGRTWTRMPPRRIEGRHNVSLAIGGAPVRYEVTLEPSDAHWLFALEMPVGLPDLPGNPVQLSGELEMRTERPLTERVRYDVISHVDYNLQLHADADVARDDWLLLPAGRNPRALAAGRELAAYPDPATRVTAVLRRFHNEPFVYTLQPALLNGADNIDDFLYGTRAGFCEHYAGAFVFLMRAAGVPSRVVTGYQGGEFNPLDGFVTVRQSDAHAWAEVWLEDRGWVRVDPTAAVSPDRVQRSQSRARAAPPFGLRALGSLMRPQDPNSPLARFNFALGALNNGWNQWVLNYSAKRQQDVLARLGAVLWRWQTPAVLAACMLLLLLGSKLIGRSRADPVDRLYSALCQRLAQRGLPRAPDEAPAAYAARIVQQAGVGLPDEARTAAAEFLRRYSAWRYAQGTQGSATYTTLKALLSRVR